MTTCLFVDRHIRTIIEVLQQSRNDPSGALEALRKFHEITDHTACKSASTTDGIRCATIRNALENLQTLLQDVRYARAQSPSSDMSATDCRKLQHYLEASSIIPLINPPRMDVDMEENLRDESMERKRGNPPPVENLPTSNRTPPMISPQEVELDDSSDTLSENPREQTEIHPSSDTLSNEKKHSEGGVAASAPHKRSAVEDFPFRLRRRLNFPEPELKNPVANNSAAQDTAASSSTPRQRLRRNRVSKEISLDGRNLQTCSPFPTEAGSPIARSLISEVSRRSRPWNPAEEDAFIASFNREQGERKAFKRISEQLRSQGFYRSEQQCRDKLKNLVKQQHCVLDADGCLTLCVPPEQRSRSGRFAAWRSCDRQSMSRLGQIVEMKTSDYVDAGV